MIHQLDASHYWSRRHEGTRFDPDNVHSLCSSCHRELGGHTRKENGKYDKWIKSKLGIRKYALLKVRANTYCKRDDVLQEIIIKKLIQELERK